MNERRVYSKWNGVWRRFSRRIGESRLASKLVGGFIWLTVGSVLSRLATLIATIFVARILGQVEYGEFSAIRWNVNAFVALAAFGMGRTATKYIAEFLVVDRERVGRIVALNYLFVVFSSLVVAIGFCVAAPFLCATIGAPRLVFEVRISSILLILTAIGGVQAGVLAGFQAFRRLAIASAASGFALIPFFLSGAYWGGVCGATLGFAVGTFVNCLINGVFIWGLLRKNGVRYRFSEAWREIGVLWSFCLPSTLAALTTSFVAWGYGILLTRQPNGLAEMALFDAARQIQTAALYLPNMAAQVILPALTTISATRDRGLYVKTVKYNVAFNAESSGLVAVVAAIFAVPAMKAFGPGFEAGVGTLVALVCAGVVASVCGVCGSILTSWGTIWTSFWLNSIWGAAMLTAVWTTARWEMGALGVGLSSLFAYLLHLVCCCLFIRSFFRKNFQDGSGGGASCRQF